MKNSFFDRIFLNGVCLGAPKYAEHLKKPVFVAPAVFYSRRAPRGCSALQKILPLSRLYNIPFLKGQSHEIFDPRFFSSINTYGPPDLWVKAVSNINSYSRRYSIMKIDSALCRIGRSRFLVSAIEIFFLKIICREDPLCINF
jgi:hypothetical protein